MSSSAFEIEDGLNTTETPARILVVDDQPANIQMVGAALGNLGHEIIPAADGVTALRRMELRPPDLILLDLLMPGMDGIEVCQKLRDHPQGKNIPVIFLSAADDKALIVRALESGGVDYVTKPFNQAELLSRVRTQLALKSARDRLQQLAEDKDELLGILAHDLKNHLAGVQMSAQLLQSRVKRASQEDEGAVKLADNIAHTSGQLLGFVKEFLANAAADHGLKLKLARLDLTAAAVAAMKQYEQAARSKGQQLSSELPSERVWALADSTALTQVLDNLLSNALKFSPSGKSVILSIKRSSDHVQCSVRDEGPGFTEEDKANMFRRYGRLSAKPTGGEPSTGLGLSIVRKLVQAMNGELACESAPGKGTVFTVQLPKAAAP